MYGRESELAELTAGILAALNGSGRVLVIQGVAGIGKTTLADTALARLDQAGWGRTVLRARGNPLDRDFPFGVARQAFAPLQAAPGWRQLCRGPAALAGRVLTSGDPPPASTPDAMYAATHGLFCLTTAVAARQAAVLFVDDAHWADLPSQRWLAGVARRVGELPLALVLTVRTGEPLLGDLLAGTVLELGPLDETTSRALIRARFPAATSRFAAACHVASGGNPFLLTHTDGQPTTHSQPATDSQHVTHQRATPEEPSARGSREVARWLTLRLERMPAGCAALATAVAVLGTTTRLSDAARLAGLPLDRAAACADALRIAGLLAPAEWAPANPMIATALLQNLGPAERAVRHARAADLLAARGGDPERTAVHLLRSEPAGRPEVADLLRTAAARATGRGAPEIAATYLSRALEEPPADDAPIRLELALALAAGRREGATVLAHEAVARIADPAARAEAALRCGRALTISAHGAAAIAVFRLAPDDSPAVPAATRARLDAEIAGAAGMDSRTMPLNREFAARSRAAPPPLPLWRVIEAMTDTFDGRPARHNLAHLRALLDDGTLTAEHDSILPTVAGLTLIANGDLGAARAMSEAVAREAGPRGWLSTVAHGRFLRSLAVLPAGLVSEAVADARAAADFKLSCDTPPGGLLFALCPLLDALVEADRLTDAEALLRTSFPGEPPPHALSSPLFLQSRGRLRWARNRPADAITDLRAAGEMWRELGVRHPAWATWRADLVAPMLAVGEQPGDLAAEHLALAEAAEAPGPLSTALRVAASTAPRDQRLSLVEQAVKISDGSPDRLAHAYALVALGSALRRAGRREAARDPLRTALNLTATGGAHRLAALATAELHATGARPRRAALRGPESLTTAEHQIAGLAATGLTNREIATRLTLSRRTVETHLAHAYAKLAIASRRDLDAALRTHR
ncbi:AAA family ATPase [Paractinoplanes maris]|uniref:AAA family ATPase n=1 Tax=Paractinoplanes maris TaxID=1734446 RepID=UPI0020206D79|nr:LuxR family transcriptional regulator [Actinoplanes maris]